MGLGLRCSSARVFWRGCSRGPGGSAKEAAEAGPTDGARGPGTLPRTPGGRPESPNSESRIRLGPPGRCRHAHRSMPGSQTYVQGTPPLQFERPGQAPLSQQPEPTVAGDGGPTKGVRTWSPRQPPGQDLRGPEHTLGTPVTGTATPTEPCVTASSRKPIAPSHLPSSTACLPPAPAQAAAGCPTLTGVPWGGTCSLPVGPELGGWGVGTTSSQEQGPPVHTHEGGTRGAR